MKIDQYKVTVTFDLAMLSEQDRPERVVLELNSIFHDTIEIWVKNNAAIASPTKTTLEGTENQ